MLKLLKINNIALIRSLEVEWDSGLVLLTGETGAGKSIIIDALGLVLGERASGEMIRAGEERASVEAEFEAVGLELLLEARGIPANDGQILLRREVQASGKGRASVNGVLVPVAVLRELGGCLASVHGQHEPQGLLDPETHLPLVDRFAKEEERARSVAEAFGRWKAAETELAAHRRGCQEAERRRETLAYQVAEIEKASLTVGEEEVLRRERAVQAHAGRLDELSLDAYTTLYDDEAAVLPRLSHVFRCVDEMRAIDPTMAEQAEKREGIKALLEDLAFHLRDYRDGIAVTPGRLDEIESRLSFIERLKKKYGASVREVLEFADACRRELDLLVDPEARERALEAGVERRAAEFLDGALRLSRTRRLRAAEMEKRVGEALSELAMDKARFEVRFSPRDAVDSGGGAREHWTARGLESAEFYLCPNQGEEPRPLARIASGGELSRILLALKSVATLDAAGKTLVFDEVDSGIGGGVAEVVGRTLKKMARTNQVLCVTHLPQIASVADQHLVIRKAEMGGRTTTDVRAVAGEDRVQELARMLGGETITETARDHAREMLATAAPRHP